ncbi:hypothetical protein Hypma_001592 [Hypsizygus marmoreus]|uniref:BTB domain-containing protein n=1 Tax=Hypsizygus marmoreus TaxID=39966 RepID=A0A369JDD7_HYPMA|nr:hypothetical protein Hypma_001592 [Hypsizygus marmoreus]
MSLNESTELPPPDSSSSVSSNRMDGSGASDLIKDDKYHLDTVVFRVEDRSFMIPKYHFEKSTDYFTPLFQKGDTVISLQDVSIDEFTALLKLLYPTYSQTPTLSQNEWLSVLKLATRWTMIEPRQFAIDHLDLESMLPTERLILAKAYNVADWMQLSYIQLLPKMAGMPIKEASKLGLELAVRLCRIVDGILLNYFREPRFESSGIVVEELFKEEFEDEPAKLDAIDRVVMARECGVAEWLWAALRELIERPTGITPDEVEKLGLETTFNLYQARMRYLYPIRQKAQENFLNRDINIMDAIYIEFEDELEEMERQAGKFHRPSSGSATPTP